MKEYDEVLRDNHKQTMRLRQKPKKSGYHEVNATLDGGIVSMGVIREMIAERKHIYDSQVALYRDD